MPVGVYHRKRIQFGLQYCPSCLAEDEEPYFRRTWRLAFVTICSNHDRALLDRCPRCRAAVNFHRDELGDVRKFAPTSMTICYSCNFDLRDAVKDRDYSCRFNVEEINFTKGLIRLLNERIYRMSNISFLYPHLFFDALRQFMKVLCMQDKGIRKLRDTICDTYQIEPYIPPDATRQPDIQEQGISERRQLLGLTRCLLEEWPDRFITLSQRCGVWSSVWLRHLGSGSRGRSHAAPFWFWKVVHDHLYRTRYCPSEEEIKAAIFHLRRRGIALTKSSLARLLGVAVIRQPLPDDLSRN